MRIKAFAPLSFAILITVLFSPRLATAQVPNWTVNPGQFEYLMNIIGVVVDDANVVTSSGDYLAAFASTELRGVTETTQVGSQWMFFMTVYGEENNDALSFRYYNAASNKDWVITESVFFSIDDIRGTVTDPVQFSLDGIIEISAVDLQVNTFPNPFSSETYIQYIVDEQVPVKVEVFDAIGRHVTTLVEDTQFAGTYEVRFDAGDLPNGLYIVQLQIGAAAATRAIILNR